jgi:hypothetical protein
LDKLRLRRELQDLRLAEVRALTGAEWQDLRARMSRASGLPKLAEHWRKHGAEFIELGIMSVEQMEALFFQHIQRTDLVYFTYISTQRDTQYRQWVLIGMDNHVVALYNESRERHWSFMRPENFPGYWDAHRDLWVRVEDLAGRLEVQRWQQR